MSNPKRHNRRQRKKLRLGEFQEFGFEITGTCAESLSADATDQFLDGLVAFVEARCLCTGGSFDGSAGGKLAMFVAAMGRNSATEEDRLAVETWLQSQPCLRDAAVGPLRDAWHGWDQI